MGTLGFNSDPHVAEIDDRTLAHLQLVIVSKLRRDERFTLRLAPEDGISGPVTVLWITSAHPLRFTYEFPVNHRINPEWLQLLAQAASSNTGLWMIPEPMPTPAREPAERSRRREKVPA